MPSQEDCPNCGSAEHYVLTSRSANRFGVTGSKVKAVECADCGRTTNV